MKNKVKDILTIILAGVLFSCGFELFNAPNGIAPGGASGLCIVLSHFTGLSEGILYFMINIPLIITGFIFLGKYLMIKSFIAIVTISLMTDMVFSRVPYYSGDKLLAAIFGGALIGAGLGLCFRCESTSGGMDIINKIVNQRQPQLSIGAVTFITDLIVIGIAAVTFGSIESALYAVISMFVSSRVIDFLVYGSYEGKLLFIFSDEYESISREILSIGRGVTGLYGRGAYTNEDKQIICCAVGNNQYVKIKRIVKSLDPDAFMIISRAKEDLGEGFKKLS